MVYMLAGSHTSKY